MALGKTLEEAMKITNATVAEELGGLPKNKLHCSNLGADALHAAINDFKKKLAAARGEKLEAAPAGDKCYCPYCEGPIEGVEEFCGHCQLELEECSHCGSFTKKGEDKCVSCGAQLEHH